MAIGHPHNYVGGIMLLPTLSVFMFHDFTRWAGSWAAQIVSIVGMGNKFMNSIIAI